MMTIIINLSPRTNGTSVMLSDYCKERIEKAGHRVTTANLYQNLSDTKVLLDRSISSKADFQTMMKTVILRRKQVRW